MGRYAQEVREIVRTYTQNTHEIGARYEEAIARLTRSHHDALEQLRQSMNDEMDANGERYVRAIKVLKEKTHTTHPGVRNDESHTQHSFSD